MNVAKGSAASAALAGGKAAAKPALNPLFEPPFPVAEPLPPAPGHPAAELPFVPLGVGLTGLVPVVGQGLVFSWDEFVAPENWRVYS